MEAGETNEPQDQRVIARQIAKIFQARLAKNAVDDALLGGTGEPMLAVFMHRQARWLGAFDWGLTPQWRPPSDTGQLHSRAETLSANAGNRPLTVRRCIIPLPFVHQKVTRPGLGAHTLGKRSRVERCDGGFLAVAGIWDEWRSPDGSDVRRTCALVTVPPNDVVAQIHDRMPAILEPNAWDLWLDPAERDPSRVLTLLQPWIGAALRINFLEKGKAKPKLMTGESGDLFS